MSRASHAAEDPQPIRIGPYLLQDKLGAGGMGEVYRAWDTRLDRAVAAKKVLGKDARKEKNRQRIRNEARAIASLSHPAVIRVFDLVETDENDWIVMELVEGRTLRSVLENRVIVETEALALAREITEGLSVAHGKGLVHRDLKSDNVMVTHLGHVKILDFGLAQHFDEEESGSSSLHEPRRRVMGTSRAMSPEQAKGLQLDPRSDLFALGSLLYEMVTGQSPFQGSSNYVTMTRVCYHRQRPAREVRPTVSPELSNFIDHLLEKGVERRPQSAAEVSMVLDSLAGIAPLPPSLVYLLWPTESTVIDSAALSDSTADVPRFLPQSVLANEDLRSSIFVWTVYSTELTNAAELLRCGDAPASRIFQHYDRTVRDLLAEFSGLEIEKAEGFVLLFRRPIDAVRFALTLERDLCEVAAELEVDLVSRTGIHVGEVRLRENPPGDVERGAKRFEAEGATKAIAGRVMQQARPDQILITQGVYELARLARLDLDDSDREVEWKEHSRPSLPGLDDTMALFEVVREGQGRPQPPREPVPCEPETDAGKRRRRWASSPWWRFFGRFWPPWCRSEGVVPLKCDRVPDLGSEVSKFRK